MISGGNLPYQIAWSNPGLPALPAVSGLKAGRYAIQITDTLGCADTASITLLQPDTLVLSLISVSEAFCDWANGSVMVEATGGVVPYAFIWDEIPGLDGPEALDVFGGNYTVWVRDEHGCGDSLSVFVSNIPPAVADFTTSPPTDQPIIFSQ
ncbi:MAG: hypothetical protein R3C61_21070 [Bacteroidia bacterium]